MRRITITEGLVELKTLDARINKGLTDMNSAVAVVENAKATPEFKDEYSKKVRSAYQSVKDLIDERNKIKSAIVKSNAETRVKVGSREMTVAEAIEYKSSIKYEKELAAALLAGLTNAEGRYNAYNERLQTRIDGIVQQMGSNDRSDFVEAQKLFAENYKASNGYALLDPLDAKKEAQGISEKITDFLKNVDVALTLSNAITFIEV